MQIKKKTSEAEKKTQINMRKTIFLGISSHKMTLNNAS